MTDYLKVAGHDGLVRDTSTKAIVNTNRAGYDTYISQRNQRLEQQSQIERHETELNIVKSELSEIKQLLQALLDK